MVQKTNREMTLLKYISYLLIMMLLTTSCASSLPKNFAKKYYTQNERTIVRMEVLYNKLYKTKPIAVEFTDNAFKRISIEMKTDSLNYIYEFDLNDQKLKDTLHKFKYDTSGVMALLRAMQSIKCTWIIILITMLMIKNKT